MDESSKLAADRQQEIGAREISGRLRQIQKNLPEILAEKEIAHLG